MADEPTEETPPEVKPKSNKKLIIMIGGGVALLLILSLGAFFMMGSSDEGDEEIAKTSDANPGESTEEMVTPPVEKTVTVTFGRTIGLGTFHANLGNPLENRFVRLEISIEYKGGDDQLKEIESRSPQLRDAVLSVASRKTREHLLAPDGKDQLRLEIFNRINQYMDRKIEAVYITDLLIE